MPIYTRTGDKGKTSLGSGKRVWKDSSRVDAYGDIDELNSLIGVAISETRFNHRKHNKYLTEILTVIQSDLFAIGGNLANPHDTSLLDHLPQRIKKFEHEIDYAMRKNPPLKTFILPQGTRVASLLQLARTVSRRAERKIISLSRKDIVNDHVLIYVNRLSDLFLALALFANYSEKVKEIPWSREKRIK